MTTSSGFVRRADARCCCAIVLLWLSGCADRREPIANRIEFHRDIAPIFRARCEGCHGIRSRQGGLRLDVREFALKGGLSGKPLLNSSSSEGELLRRITSDNPTLVMPKEGGKLTDHDVDLIRRWLTQGAPWPDADETSGATEFIKRYEADVWDRMTVAGRELKPIYVMVFALLLGAADRIRRSKSDRPLWSSRVGRIVWRASQHVSALWFVVALLVVATWDVVEFSARQAARLAETEQKLVRAQTAGHVVPFSQDGVAPKPMKLRNVPKFGGTYYRGNDERSDQLFNGGDYRTATLLLSMVDEQDRPVQLGQRLPSRQLFIRFEIQRARSATTALFSDEIVNSVVLSRRTFTTKEAMPDDVPVRLAPIEPGERWAARYRLAEYDGQADAALDGVLYVYTGAPLNEAIQGTIHYGISYSLRVADHSLRDNAELWMGPILVPNNFFLVEPGKITLSEWLDIHPIPEITGQNSTDPNLLGIPEHYRKK